jgi:hypothetical protein
MIATCGRLRLVRLPVSLFPILVLLATAAFSQPKCTEKIISDSGIATSRETAERNANAKLTQKLKRLGDSASGVGTPEVECKQPLLWHCTVSVKACVSE